MYLSAVTVWVPETLKQLIDKKVKEGSYGSRSMVLRMALVKFFNKNHEMLEEKDSIYRIVKTEIANYLDRKKRFLAKMISKKYGLSIYRVAVTLSYFIRNLKESGNLQPIVRLEVREW